MISQEIYKSIEQGRLFEGIGQQIRNELSINPKVIVILDDDPTGTQTVHGVPVVTEWSEITLEKMFAESQLFFILTNSRSLQAEEADVLGELIGKRLGKIAQKLDRTLVVISRSDSTLRGHYPNEVNALKEGLGWKDAKELLVPAFFEGGRYTYNDIHYVKEGEQFVPAAETPFAKDNTFGYRSSNLKEWVEEKTSGQITKNAVTGISVKTIRKSGVSSVSEILDENTSHLIVNATAPYDLQLVALACLKHKGNIIYRTAASFINAISGIRPKTLEVSSLISKKNQEKGSLTIIGSYVPKTTAQLDYLKKQDGSITFLEFKLDELHNNAVFSEQIIFLSKLADVLIEKGTDVVLYTSREVRSGKTKEESLKIVNKVSSGLVSLVQRLKIPPKYFIAKGGITSSDIAVKGLNVKLATVAGQVLDGVPIWLLDDQSKFPNMPYIVFPGNVGDETSIHKLIQLSK